MSLPNILFDAALKGDRYGKEMDIEAKNRTALVPVALLNAAGLKIQDLCPHPKTTLIHSASGNESYLVCDECGKVVS